MNQAAAAAQTLPRPKRSRRVQEHSRPKRQPRYSVILWNDDDHTFAYVIVMMMELFGYPAEKGFQIARAVDAEGRAVVITTTREHAELKRDQIHAFGKDGMIEKCAGSMWATVEAVETR